SAGGAGPGLAGAVTDQVVGVVDAPGRSRVRGAVGGGVARRGHPVGRVVGVGDRFGDPAPGGGDLGGVADGVQVELEGRDGGLPAGRWRPAVNTAGADAGEPAGLVVGTPLDQPGRVGQRGADALAGDVVAEGPGGGLGAGESAGGGQFGHAAVGVVA